MYYWDEVAKRYRDERGRFVSRSTVWDFIQKSIGNTYNVTDLLAELVSSGKLAPKDWYSLMKEELKREYIRQYLLAHGGVGTMTPADWGRIGAMLKEQYAYLKNFAAEIASGNLTAAQIAARAKMYFNSSREAYETAHMINAVAWGAVEERWQVSYVVENCPDCLGYMDEGWKPVGYFPVPGSGSTICLCLVSPEVRVLTFDGWKHLFDVRVGDMVYTHKSRYCRVSALIAKRSLPTHKLEKIGNVYCTDTHLFNTDFGWLCASHINERKAPLYIDGWVRLPGGIPESKIYKFPYADYPLLAPAYETKEGVSFRDRFGLGLIAAIGNADNFKIGETLPKDTVVFDLEVEEDHSFCVEGLFAHNTNCHCWKEYRNAKGEVYYA